MRQFSPFIWTFISLSEFVSSETQVISSKIAECTEIYLHCLFKKKRIIKKAESTLVGIN
jgi:hypothetical protein